MVVLNGLSYNSTWRGGNFSIRGYHLKVLPSGSFDSLTCTATFAPWRSPAGFVGLTGYQRAYVPCFDFFFFSFGVYCAYQSLNSQSLLGIPANPSTLMPSLYKFSSMKKMQTEVSRFQLQTTISLGTQCTGSGVLPSVLGAGSSRPIAKSECFYPFVVRSP